MSYLAGSELPEGASGEGDLQNPLLAAAVKAQDVVAPANAVAFAAPPELCLCLQIET